MTAIFQCKKKINKNKKKAVIHIYLCCVLIYLTDFSILNKVLSGLKESTHNLKPHCYNQYKFLLVIHC